MTIKAWNIDTEWQEPFVAGLHTRGANENVVGAALSDVDRETTRTGKTAFTLFGDPTEYAQGIVLPGTQAADRSRIRAIVVAVIGLIGMFLTLWGFTGLQRNVDHVAGMSPWIPFVIGALLALGAAVFDTAMGAKSDVFAMEPGQKPTPMQFAVNKLAPWVIVALTLIGMLIIWLRYR